MQNNYSAVVTANTLARSKTNHTPSVQIQVRTICNLSTGESVAKTMTGDLWLTQNTVERTTETLANVFGWVGESFSELNMPILAGIEVEIVTNDEEYNGKTYEKLAFFNRPGESSARSIKPAEAGEARAIASQYDAVLRNLKAKGIKPAAVKRCATLDLARSQQSSAQSALPALPPETGGCESESGFTPTDDLPF